MTKAEFAALKGRILLDGATGSNLMKAGMPIGVCAEAWIRDNPQTLSDLQKAYVEAGSQIVYAPTFSANRHSLARHGLQTEVTALNRELVALAKQSGAPYVAGDMTTTGIPLEPLGTMKYEELFDIYAEQAAALSEGGADLIVIETMLGLEETTVALEAVQSVCDLPVMCSMTVQTDGGLYFGGSLLEAAPTLQTMGASAVGINCSLGPEQLVSLVRNLRQAVELPLLVKPNAGIPLITEQGEAVYPLGPEEFSRAMEPIAEAGATLIGGCCGTDPRYIAQLHHRFMQNK